jgi:23S rRNA (guanosine2251-2'-O)-methyltransferase
MSFIKKTMPELNRPSSEQAKLATNYNKLCLVLDNIRSMHNVGSLFRTADGMGINGLHLCGYTPQPPHREINKTALGATESVAWQHHESTQACLQQLATQGYTIIALEQTHNSTPLHKFVIDTAKQYALVVGNELEGVSEQALHLCHSVIEIPQMGAKHSFNVSVSAAILVWEFYKQISLEK